MPITNTPPFNAYTGNGTTTQFAYQFYLLDKADLAVMVDGVKRPTSDYTLTGVGNNGGGNVTFKTAPADQSRVLIQRQTALKRDTDYALNGDMLAPTLNEDFDRLWALGQELADESGRALVRPPAGVDYSADGHQITDLSDPKTPQSAATKAYVDKEVLTVVTDIVEKATEQADRATSQAGAASTSAQQAAGSSSSASTSAQNAARSEGNANTSKSAAAGSATAAAGSATTSSDAASRANQSAGQAQGFASGAQASASGAADARTAAQQAASLAQTQAGKAADSATASAGSATTAGQNATAAGQQADRAKAEADRAQTANPDNQLKKAQNLADVADPAAARNNIGLGGLLTLGTESRIANPTNLKQYVFMNLNGKWGAYDSDAVKAIPLDVDSGGTGAPDAAGARTNLGLDRFHQSALGTGMSSPNQQISVEVYDNGKWGAVGTDGVPRPLGVPQGGTGAPDAAGARTNLGLGNSAIRNVHGYLVPSSSASEPVATQTNLDYRPLLQYDTPLAYPLGLTGGLTQGDHLPGSGIGAAEVCGLINVRGWNEETGIQSCFQIVVNQRIAGFRWPVLDPSSGNWYYSGFISWWHGANTTVDTNGFIKRASPIIKLFADGTAETNDESEGATVERVDVGQYLITGVLGMNSDAAWGGIDGGFELPKDRNGQPLIWLDYDINADGSILVKTYHRTYPEAPAFARNEIKDLNEGEPVDIPKGLFVSVRVEMPQDSAWNQRQEAARKAAEEAERNREEEAESVPTEDA